MTRKLLAALALAGGFAVSRGDVGDALQDAQGQVWAIRNDRLEFWSDDHWVQYAHAPQHRGAQTRAGLLTLTADKKVLGLWVFSSPVHRFALGLVETNSFQPVGEWPGWLWTQRLRMFQAADGAIWIMGGEKEIHRVIPGKEALETFTITPALLRANSGQGSTPDIGYVHAFEDQQHRIWFWTRAQHGYMTPVVQGVVLFDKGEFRHVPAITGVPDQRYDVVAPVNTGEVWIAIGPRIYAVNTATLTAKPVEMPATQRLAYSEQIRAVGDAVYVVGVKDGKPDDPHRGGAVWRWRQGVWKLVVTGLDPNIGVYRTFISQQLKRPWLDTAQGFYVGTSGDGLWYVPANDAAAVHINWRFDWKVMLPQGLFALINGELLAIDRDATFGHRPLPQPTVAAQTTKQTFSTLAVRCPLARDARGHLWTFFHESNELQEWDGDRWTARGRPVSISKPPCYILADNRGRVWLMPQQLSEPVNIYATDTKTWLCFASYREALQAQLPDAAAFHLGTDEFAVPRFADGQRIVFCDNEWRINYFDGAQWRAWDADTIDAEGRKNSAGEVPASTAPMGFALTGPAFFDKDGALLAPVRDVLWRYTKATGWIAAKSAVAYLTFNEVLSRRIGRSPTANLGETAPDSTAYDQLGVCWFTSRGRLFKAWGKVVREVLAQTAHPFSDGRPLGEAVADGVGNVFLSITLGRKSVPHEYMLVAASRPPPQLQVRLEQPLFGGHGLTKLVCNATASEPVVFTWRADEGNWCQPQTNGELVVAGLPPGEHRIEALALAGSTLCARQPTQLLVRVRTSAAAQADWLLEGALTAANTDDKRAALAGLLALGSEALPSVRRALEKADDAHRPTLNLLAQQLEHESRCQPADSMNWQPVSAAECSQREGISAWCGRIQGRYVHDWE